MPEFPTPDELAALLPQYRFERMLAQGGMGAVYAAEQISLGRPVAIKVLSRESSADGPYRERFVTEARLLGRLRHPNIVDVHDFGEAGGLLYIVMELLEGRTLLARIHRQPPLTQPEIVRIAVQICDALAAAHAHGVVHRDVKPENIFLDDSLHVKLGDFGIARPREARDADDPDGYRMATPEYAAPEMFDFARPVDHRADIFSLGVVLYEMLTGGRPDPTVFVPPSHRRPQVSTRFDAIVRRAMQASPDSRYPTAEAMKWDIAQVLKAATRPLQPSRGPAGPGRGAGTGRRRSIAGRAAVIGAAAAGVAAAAIFGLPALSGNSGGADSAAAEERTSAGALFPEVAGSGSGTSGSPADGNNSPETSSGPVAGSTSGASSSSPVPEPEPDPQPPPFVRGDPDGDGVFEWNGHYYQFVSVGMSWAEAEARARSRGGYLAVITSKEENDAVIGYVSHFMDRDHDTCWIGATDEGCEGKWEWVTGEPFEFTDWGSGAPNDGGLEPHNFAQHHLSLNLRDDYGGRVRWNDHRYPTGGRVSFLIEWDSAEGPMDPDAKPRERPVPPTGPPPPGATGNWHPLRWTEAELAPLRSTTLADDGTMTFPREAAWERHAGFGFRHAVVRARVRSTQGSSTVQLRFRQDDGDCVGAAFTAGKPVSLFQRNDSRVANVPSDAESFRLASTGESILELRVVEDRIVALVNGAVAASADAGTRRPFCGIQIAGENVSVRELQWIPLPDSGSESRLALAPPPPPTSFSELVAAVTEFRQSAGARFATKLDASLRSLRESYAKRLRELAESDEANVSIYLDEAALVESGSNPPETAGPGEPSVLAGLRKTWHAEFARRHAAAAPAAVPVYRAFIDKLTALSRSCRDSARPADACDAGAWLEAAKLQLKPFESARPGGPAARW